MSTNEQLQDLMDKHQLSTADLSKLINKSSNTIKSWIAKSDTTKFRRLPNQMLAYIKAKIILQKCNKKPDIEHQITDRTLSIEYHLKNALDFFEHLTAISNLDKEIAKELAENLNAAYDDICLTNQLLMETFPIFHTYPDPNRQVKSELTSFKNNLPSEAGHETP